MEKSLPILDPSLGTEPEADGTAAAEKLDALRETLAPRVREGVLVAFSGGMDSAFLLWVVSEVRKEVGGEVAALTTTSASTPAGDRADALSFAKGLGVTHLWRESGEIHLPEYTKNDPDRCFHCKTELFRIAGDVAAEEGLQWLLYGYNASDHTDHRPGHRAAQEAGALSPLSEVGLTKGEIRLLMEAAALPLSRKPASPCLSSRIMTGIEITPDRLMHVEEIESILRRAGVNTLRVRVCQSDGETFFLRVEVAPEEMGKVLDCRKELQEAGVARGYRWVTLDLGGYRTGGGVS